MLFVRRIEESKCCALLLPIFCSSSEHFVAALTVSKEWPQLLLSRKLTDVVSIVKSNA